MPQVLSSTDVCGYPGMTLRQGDIALGLVPSLGGRILSLRVRGEEWLFAGPDHGPVPLPAAPADLRAYKQASGFKVWGGDKTWIAPEKDWPDGMPPLDLDAGPYQAEISGASVLMTSPVCRETGLQITRALSFFEDGRVQLRETLTNTSARAISRGIWNVTQIPRPFTLYLPAGPQDVRSYHLQDPTLPEHKISFSQREGMNGVPCVDAVLFKYGALLAQGNLVTVKPLPSGKELVWERSFAVSPELPYAHRSMVEVFNTDRYGYGEVEVHSPLYTLESGQSCSLEQVWSFKM